MTNVHRRHARLPSIRSRVAVLDSRVASSPAKTAHPFYQSVEWRKFRDGVIADRGRQCEACGRNRVRLYADHIVELNDGGRPLDARNIRILCGSCHTRKTVAVRAERMRS